MLTAHLFKITRDTNLFKKGQKVWSDGRYNSQQAIGRYKGKGRWILAHIHAEDGFDNGINCKYIGEIEISREWGERLHALSRNDLDLPQGYTLQDLKKADWLVG